MLRVGHDVWYDSGMSGVMIFAVSGTLLAAFTVLVRAETARGRRFILSGLRERLDRIVVAATPFAATIRRHIGNGSIRVMLHYIAHGIISRLARLSERMGAYFARLERRNRKVVRAIRERETTSHLDKIAVHKATVALSDEARAALKQRSLEGDL